MAEQAGALIQGCGVCFDTGVVTRNGVAKKCPANCFTSLMVASEKVGPKKRTSPTLAQMYAALKKFVLFNLSFSAEEARVYIPGEVENPSLIEPNQWGALFREAQAMKLIERTNETVRSVRKAARGRRSVVWVRSI